MLIAISEIFMSTQVCKNLKISIAKKERKDFDRDAKTEICIPLIPASVNAPNVS